MPIEFPNTTFKSPQMLDFFHGKRDIGIRNVVPKWKLAPESRNNNISSMKVIPSMHDYNPIA